MCVVIKIRLKRRDERGSGKGNPKKRLIITPFETIFMTSHLTLSSASADLFEIMGKIYGKQKDKKKGKKSWMANGVIEQIFD